jgi:hypothetical protein
MSASRAKQRQAQERVNHASGLAKSLGKPLGGWIAAFQEAIGMNAPALAERLGISRNNIYAAIQNEQAGTISLNQLDIYDSPFTDRNDQGIKGVFPQAAVTKILEVVANIRRSAAA